MIRRRIISQKRIHLIVSGTVQGVGYRAWAKRAALQKRLVGWVKNRSDGAVEIVAEGEEEALSAFIDDCKKGPEVALVLGVTSDWATASGDFLFFDIQ